MGERAERVHQSEQAVKVGRSALDIATAAFFFFFFFFLSPSSSSCCCCLVMILRLLAVFANSGQEISAEKAVSVAETLRRFAESLGKPRRSS